MQNVNNNKRNLSNTKSPFEFFIEAIGWLQIVASPLLIGLILGAIIYLPDPNGKRLIFAIAIVVMGLIVGILWATKVWKRKGTQKFMSGLMTTSEPDSKKEQQEP